MQESPSESLLEAAPSKTSIGGNGPRPLAPMDARMTTIQPGGGPVMQLELAWGRLRRAYLRTFRRGYVARMRKLRRGEAGGIPIDPIDPRDVKYYCNQATYYWDAKDDPFRWREALPFVRAGLAELLVIGGGFALLTVLLGWLWWPAAIPPAVVTLLVAWFFRDPHRTIPAGPGEICSPADGKVVQIEKVDDPDIGPAWKIGIFLSIFNVHANRASEAGRVLAVRYSPGKFLNALRPESAQENERLEILLEQPAAPYRLLKICQITGQFARRIVCWVRPGDHLQRGEMFGMIKLGSRTELLLADRDGLEVVSKIGDNVAAGSTLMARYTKAASSAESTHATATDQNHANDGAAS